MFHDYLALAYLAIAGVVVLAVLFWIALELWLRYWPMNLRLAEIILQHSEQWNDTPRWQSAEKFVHELFNPACVKLQHHLVRLASMPASTEAVQLVSDLQRMMALSVIEHDETRRDCGHLALGHWYLLAFKNVTLAQQHADQVTVAHAGHLKLLQTEINEALAQEHLQRLVAWHNHSKSS
jgi:hypothetical protein